MFMSTPHPGFYISNIIEILKRRQPAGDAGWTGNWLVRDASEKGVIDQRMHVDAGNVTQHHVRGIAPYPIADIRSARIRLL
jgi:hypothetical protein